MAMIDTDTICLIGELDIYSSTNNTSTKLYIKKNGVCPHNIRDLFVA